MSNKLLGISLPQQSKKDILDKIIKYTLSQNSFVHIVSLNPENIVIAQHDKLFKEIVVGHSSVGRLRVVLIGGKDKLAESLADCYSHKYPHTTYIGLKGIENIKNPKKSEEDGIFSIITDIKPHLLFVSFGSPYQEKWIWNNRKRLKGIVCMGVGGAFDYLSGVVKRPPFILRKIGLEWFYRLIIQPWRWKRQLRLISFMWLVLKQKFNVE